MEKNYIQKIVDRLDEKFKKHFGEGVKNYRHKGDVLGHYAILAILKGEDVTKHDLHHIFNVWLHGTEYGNFPIFLTREEQIEYTGSAEVHKEMTGLYIRFIKEVAVEIKEGKLKLD